MLLQNYINSPRSSKSEQSPKIQTQKLKVGPDEDDEDDFVDDIQVNEQISGLHNSD